MARSRIVSVGVIAAVGAIALAVGAVSALVDLGVATLSAVALAAGVALLALAAVLALLHGRAKARHLEERIDRSRSEHTASLANLRSTLDEVAGDLHRTSSELAEVAGQVTGLQAGSEHTDSRVAELGRTLDRTTRSLARDLEVARRRIEGTIRVATALGLPTPLPPLDGWAVLGDLAAELVRLVRFEPPRLVVELGGGVSTLLIAAALEGNDSGRLVSLDHDVDYLERTRAELRANGLEHRVDLVHAPLEDREFDGDPYRWYRTDVLDDVHDIDLVLVDGPPGTTGPLARFPAGPVLIPRLAPGGRILLDDANRPEEHEIARRWAAGPEGLELELLPEVGKGLAILRRR